MVEGRKRVETVHVRCGGRVSPGQKLLQVPPIAFYGFCRSQICFEGASSRRPGSRRTAFGTAVPPLSDEFLLTL
jgi:hypothetical protein